MPAPCPPTIRGLLGQCCTGCVYGPEFRVVLPAGSRTGFVEWAVETDAQAYQIVFDDQPYVRFSQQDFMCSACFLTIRRSSIPGVVLSTGACWTFNPLINVSCGANRIGCGFTSTQDLKRFFFVMTGFVNPNEITHMGLKQDGFSTIQPVFNSCQGNPPFGFRQIGATVRKITSFLQ